MHDQFATGRRFRILNVVDDVTRKCLAAIPDTSISGRRVARELAVLIAQRGRPAMIVSDNGTEFTSTAILPSPWFEKRHVGDILSRIGSASSIQDVLTRGVIAAIIDGLMAVVAVIILWVYSPTLTAVVVFAVLISLGLTMAVFPALRARTEEQIIESARE